MMALRQAVLAELGRGPGIAYQVFQRVGRHLGEPWQLIEGAVRLQLNKCVAEGLAETRTDGDGKRVYTITARGRAEVRAWAADVEAPLEPYRDDLLLKSAYLWEEPEPALLAALEGRRHDLARLLHVLTRRLVGDLPDGEDEELWRLGIERMRRVSEAELEWVEACHDRLVALWGDHVTAGLDTGTGSP